MGNSDYSNEHDVLLRLQTSRMNGGTPVHDTVWKRYDINDEDLTELVDAVDEAVRRYQEKKIRENEAWRVEARVTIDNVIIDRNGAHLSNGIEKRTEETKP